MALDERQIGTIVHQVLERLESGRPDAGGGGTPRGVHADLDAAVRAARAAFEAYDLTPLDTRRKIIAAIRDDLTASLRAISVLPTPVGPTIKMFFGVISARSASGTR